MSAANLFSNPFFRFPFSPHPQLYTSTRRFALTGVRIYFVCSKRTTLHLLSGAQVATAGLLTHDDVWRTSYGNELNKSSQPRDRKLRREEEAGGVMVLPYPARGEKRKER